MGTIIDLTSKKTGRWWSNFWGLASRTFRIDGMSSGKSKLLVPTILLALVQACAASVQQSPQPPEPEAQSNETIPPPPLEPAPTPTEEVPVPPAEEPTPVEAEEPVPEVTATPEEPTSRHTDLVYIPPACYEMGGSDGDFDERPRHEVCISGFFIDRIEVSNAAYQVCVEAGECRPGDRYPRRPTLAEPSHPVVGVSWVDSDRYCRWAGMRLPTDAEWELAAGGTDGRRYPWGNEPHTCERAVYAHCAPHSTVPVDSYPEGASPYGVLHMAGNAWEWVWDWWSSGYYRRSPRQDPTGPEVGRMRSIRGGCWNRSYVHLRVEDRDSGVVGLRNNHVGFRCACSDCGQVPASP